MIHTCIHTYIHTYIRTYISNKLKFFKLRPLEETSFEDEKRSHFSLFWGDRFSVRAERKRKGKKTKREINMWSYTYIYWTKEIISSVILECREIGISLVLAKWICSSIQLWNRFLNVALCRNFYWDCFLISCVQNQGTLAGDSILKMGCIATSTYFAPASTSGSNSGHCFAF